MSNDYLNEYAGRTVLVTGGAGAIGSNLSRKLAAICDRVFIIDDLSSASTWNVPKLDNVHFVQGDILDESKLDTVFGEKPSIIFHLAAFFANQNSVDNPQRDLMVNGMGTLRLMERATKANVDRFVYASSGCGIYGSNAPLPLTEGQMSMHLSTPYQVTKMLGELYANYFDEQTDLKVVKARLFNSFGPGEIPGRYRNVIPNFVYWSMLGRALPITGDGNETRDFTFVGDICQGFLRSGIYESAIGEEFNFGSGHETAIKDLAAMINERTGNKAGIEFKPRRKWDTKKRLLANTAKAGKIIDYKPEMQFEEGLDQVVAWFQENWDQIDAAARFEESQHVVATASK